MSNISGKCAIVGVAETKVGKRPDASTHSLHLECIKACLDDAGLKASDVDGFITNQPLNDAHRSYAVRMSNMARMRPNYATDLALGGATPIAMVQNAVMAIEAGMANTVLCVHARKRGTPDPSPGQSDPPRRRALGRTLGPFLRRGQSRLCRAAPHARLRHHQRRSCPRRGRDAETRLHERQRHHAQTDDRRRSPGFALYRASPLRLFDCALESDGGGAVHRHERRARRAIFRNSRWRFSAWASTIPISV